LNTIPEILVDDGRMLTRKGLVLVRDLAEVDSVLEHRIECSTGEGVVTGSIPGLAQSLFTSDILLLQINLKLGDAPFSEIRGAERGFLMVNLWWIGYITWFLLPRFWARKICQLFRIYF
jgi:hypothetical protein